MNEKNLEQRDLTTGRQRRYINNVRYADDTTLRQKVKRN